MAGDFSEDGGNGERGRLDATGEFFSVGVPLHAIRAGYIRRSADDQLYTALSAGRYAHVLAPDRSGKSSLVAATAARLESRGTKVAILDLAQITDRDGGDDPGRWYYNIAYRLLRQLRIRADLQEWWQDKSILSNRQRLLDFYSEILLAQVSDPIVVFVDEIQCVDGLDYAADLLSSIRAAHNARTTDPGFSRICFALLGECDPVSLVEEAELSPFNITERVDLNDFTRADLDLFATELNLDPEDAEKALDRIYYWTRGQPYLCQKIARAVAKETSVGDIDELVDHVATHQIAGRAALHNEPHMSHIHRAIVNDDKRREALLNLYGKIRKGIEVGADLGCPLQRRLMAVGLLVIDSERNVGLRNRLYRRVFTTRWANENLRADFKVPAIIVGAVLLLALIPFWYTQWLPGSYLNMLGSTETELDVALESYENFRSFPGHADTADNLFRVYLQGKAAQATDETEILPMAALARTLPDGEPFAREIEASFWDRETRVALSKEQRDEALVASIRSLVLATTTRRQRAATLVGGDYPHLLHTLEVANSSTPVFDPLEMLMTTADGAVISQFSYGPQGVQTRDPWTVTALEVNPLLRRVFVDREGIVSRIGLTLNISHSRLADLRIKIIAPSGRTIEVDPALERSSNADDIRIPREQLQDLLGESLNGTWSISVRDESLGVAGQLVGWNLKLNSQGALEYFQRGLNIPDPQERETENVWFDPSGRYAVARASQSDSARIWDLSFAEPKRAISLPESERLIGLDATARHLVTASQDKVHLWDTATGDKVGELAIGLPSGTAVLTGDRMHVFVERRGDADSRLEIWSLETRALAAELVVAGTPSMVALDASGSRAAIADFDRAVRVWDLATSSLLGQFDLPAQPGSIELSPDGSSLGVVLSGMGVSMWHVSDASVPVLEDFGPGRWRLEYSPSGALFAAGRAETGFQVYRSEDGRQIGPPLGMRQPGEADDLLAFSDDEQVLITGSVDSAMRIWRMPVTSGETGRALADGGHKIWDAALARPVAVSVDGSLVAIGDQEGHVHFVPSSASLGDVEALGSDVSFVGHNSPVDWVRFAGSGVLAASVAGDNSLRFWDTFSGEPLPISVDITGPATSGLVFSPKAAFLAVLSPGQITLVDVAAGQVVAEFVTTSLFTGASFASEDRLYLGTADGILNLASRAADGRWQERQVWQGTAGIRSLGVSPRGDYLALVDNANVASQFMLSEGRIGEGTIELPSDVREIAFDSAGSRVYFRSSRWIHRASASPQGFTWLSATLVPRGLRGAHIVNGDGSVVSKGGSRVFLPVAQNAYVELLQIRFGGGASAGLFGGRDTLLQEWQPRISAGLPEEF